MELKILKKDLLKGLEKTLTVVERRNTMPSLNHALFELKDGSLTISATDLELFVSSTVPCKSIQVGRIAVPARSVFDIVKESGDVEEIHIKSLDGNRIELLANKSQFKLLGLASDTFPHFKASPKGQLSSAKLSTKEFAKLLSKTEHSVCLEEIRYFLTGIYIETIADSANTIRAVATDGHRLAMQDIPQTQKDSVLGLKKGLIIPKKGVAELRKMLESSWSETFELTCDENLLRATTEDFQLWIRPIDGEYPDYKRVIPNALPGLCTVNRKDLIGALRRMALLVSDRSKVVTFEFKKDRIVLSTVNPDLGEASDEVSCKYQGAEFKTGFNVRFYIDALSHFEGDEIEIQLGEKLQPAILKTPESAGYLIVIMPMRI
jgi:DNA polymerase-3 subunit beta